MDKKHMDKKHSWVVVMGMGVALLAALMPWRLALSGEPMGFATGSNDMVERLLTPTAPVVQPSPVESSRRGRSVRSFTPGQPAAAPAPDVRYRKIVVTRKDRDVLVETEMQVDTYTPVAFVNLLVQFNVNSATLRPDALRVLQELGRALSDPRLAGRRFVIKGHTDSDGVDAYNLRLSFYRAEAVKAYLVGNLGIHPDRLDVLGFGENLPMAPNTTPYNKQLNRRVEVATN
jgi:outer membrane protein OmpA-like peptidoglycan-associated protein